MEIERRKWYDRTLIRRPDQRSRQNDLRYQSSGDPSQWRIITSAIGGNVLAKKEDRYLNYTSIKMNEKKSLQLKEFIFIRSFI